ncbi:MAG: NADH-quinone oxidoreductase subunit C [Actinomycetota bacterium]|nr:NADH-quinone oxidoreductase subunit C [Actinomycetota bacterium]
MADETTEDTPATDEAREALSAELTTLLGDAVLETHLRPGQNLWLRVDPDRWQDVARTLRDASFSYFGFLSAIDWSHAPEGRYEDTEFDAGLDDDEGGPAEVDDSTGYAGGDTRFQVMLQLHSITRHEAVIIKTDIGESNQIDTLRDVFAGADWHERETHEMFGISFAGHPQLDALYLPSEFEGHPLRKDFPLLARTVKPWPGVVDIEEIPAHLEEQLEAEVMAAFEASGGGE